MCSIYDLLLELYSDAGIQADYNLGRSRERALLNLLTIFESREMREEFHCHLSFPCMRSRGFVPKLSGTSAIQGHCTTLYRAYPFKRSSG